VVGHGGWRSAWSYLLVFERDFELVRLSARDEVLPHHAQFFELFGEGALVADRDFADVRMTVCVLGESTVLDGGGSVGANRDTSRANSKAQIYPFRVVKYRRESGAPF
jgi:hypothetical protein